MTKFEHEHRKNLEHAERTTRDQYNRLKEREHGELAALSAQEDHLRALAELEEWDCHLVQLVPAPPGLVAVYKDTGQEGADHRGAIVMCGLQRNGLMTLLSFDSEGTFLPAESIGNFVRFEFAEEERLNKL